VQFVEQWDHKDLNIGNIPVGQWFPNNIRGKIRIRQKKEDPMSTPFSFNIRVVASSASLHEQNKLSKSIQP
jgi:hypothetical protein